MLVWYSTTDGTLLETKKLESSKAPRYIDTQLPYTVTKNSTKSRLLLLKEKSKVCKFCEYLTDFLLQ